MSTDARNGSAASIEGVDFLALWREFNVDPEATMSVTQLELALEVSDQTRGVASVSSRVVSDPRDPDDGKPLMKVHARMADPGPDGDPWITKGYQLAPEVRPDE